MLTVLDYGAGNIKSVLNLLEGAQIPFVRSDNPDVVANASAVLFPGQGHFGRVMQALNEKNLTPVLKQIIHKGVPFFGICVGMQVLFDSSEEAEGIPGLGVFKGKIVRFTQGKVPQIGWNDICVTSANTVLKNGCYYFVNSYHAVCEDPSVVSATADYYGNFTASVEKGNVCATQFHPEKSGVIGREAVLSFARKALSC